MKNRKRIIKLLITGYWLLVTKAAFAIETGLEATRGAAGLPAGRTIPQLAGTIIKSLLGLLGVVFFLLMVYGGFIWMKARGNEKEVERAKNILTDAIIGIVIVAAAYAITVFIIRALA
jgi:hypothetical protein